MKIQKRSSSRKMLVVAAVAAGVIIAGAAYAYSAYGPTGSSKSTNKDASQEDTPAVETAPANLSPEEASKKENLINRTNDSGDKEAAAEKPATVKISISLKQEQNDSVTVYTKIYGASDGECSLIAKNGSRSFQASAKIIYQPSYSTCAGFSIKKSELGAGTWEVSVSAKTLKDGSASATNTLEVH